jgi:hypothetical protein
LDLSVPYWRRFQHFLHGPFMFPEKSLRGRV